MKRKLQSILMAAGVCLASAMIAASCGKDNGDPNPGPKPDPDPDPVEEVKPGELFSQECPTPIKMYAETTAAPADGACIEVTGIMENNFTFKVRPGANIKSYHVDVYPLCTLYNSLFNNLNVVGGEKATDAQMDEWTREFVMNSQSMGQYIFNETSLEDFQEHEFDYANSEYATFPIASSCEYVIVALGCFDDMGTEEGELTICYLQTQGNPLQGNPYVYIDVQKDHRKFAVTHTPNEDCKYIYYWSSAESDLKPFIDGYGDKMYIDFLRHTVAEPVDASDPDAMYYDKDFGVAVDPTFRIMTTAVALDANKTPSTKFQSQTFTMEKVPEGLEEAECSMTIDESRIGAGIAYFEAKMEANCRSMFYHCYKKSVADKLMAADDATKEQRAWEIDTYGFGMANQNFQWDSENNVPSGDSYTMEEFVINYVNPNTQEAENLEAGEEYVLVYTGRNAYGEISELHFTEPFKMKERIENEPAKADASFKIEASDVTRTSVKLTFSYDHAKAGLLYHQIVYPYDEGGYVPPQPGDERERWMNFFLRDRDPMYNNPYTNMWWTDPAGVETYTIAGLEPGTRYIYAYCEEDMNGYMGEVKWIEFETQKLEGGENPVAEIKTERTASGFIARFNGVQDVLKFKYLIGDMETHPGLLLDKLTSNRYEYEDIIAAWEGVCMESGMTSLDDTSLEHTKSGVDAVALCIPIGEDADGNEVYGEMQHVLWIDGDFKQLDQIKPRTGAAAAFPGLPAKIQPSVARTEEARSAQGGLMPEVKTIWLDMRKLGEHPVNNL